MDWGWTAAGATEEPQLLRRAIHRVAICTARAYVCRGDRAAVLLKNLGFSDALAARPMKELSGGWRVRATLAAALFASPVCVRVHACA